MTRLHWKHVRAIIDLHFVSANRQSELLQMLVLSLNINNIVLSLNANKIVLSLSVNNIVFSPNVNKISVIVHGFKHANVTGLDNQSMN